MKQIKDVISAPIAKLLNRPFHNVVFPNILKIAEVIPIFNPPFQKLQNCALKKKSFEKRHDRISCVCKECKILKFPDILNL